MALRNAFENVATEATAQRAGSLVETVENIIPDPRMVVPWILASNAGQATATRVDSRWAPGKRYATRWQLAGETIGASRRQINDQTNGSIYGKYPIGEKFAVGLKVYVRSATNVGGFNVICTTGYETGGSQSVSIGSAAPTKGTHAFVGLPNVGGANGGASAFGIYVYVNAIDGSQPSSFDVEIGDPFIVMGAENDRVEYFDGSMIGAAWQGTPDASRSVRAAPMGIRDRFPLASALTDDMAAGTLLSQIGARLMVYDGTTWDRVRSPQSANNATGSIAAGLTLHDLPTGNSQRQDNARSIPDAADGIRFGSTVGMRWNGASWDRPRAVNAAGDSWSGLGGVPVGNWVYDNNAGSWMRWRDAHNDGVAGNSGIGSAGNYVFNGTNWDRMRTAPGNGVLGATGIQASALALRHSDSSYYALDAASNVADGTSGQRALIAGNLLYNGSGWDRARGDAANGLDVDVTRLPASATGSDFKRVAKAEPMDGEELRFDDLTGGDLYIGAAPDGTATTTASWKVVRYYRDATGKITRTRYRTGVAWDSRTAGWS